MDNSLKLAIMVVLLVSGCYSSHEVDTPAQCLEGGETPAEAVALGDVGDDFVLAVDGWVEVSEPETRGTHVVITGASAIQGWCDNRPDGRFDFEWTSAPAELILVCVPASTQRWLVRVDGCAALQIKRELLF